jgi:hypothetical protein
MSETVYVHQRCECKSDNSIIARIEYIGRQVKTTMTFIHHCRMRMTIIHHSHSTEIL